MRERGLWHEGPAGLQVLVTLHPSALLRGEPSEREAAYRLWLNDLAMAADQMAGTAAH
jgi:DNA polymerase